MKRKINRQSITVSLPGIKILTRTLLCDISVVSSISVVISSIKDLEVVRWLDMKYEFHILRFKELTENFMYEMPNK